MEVSKRDPNLKRSQTINYPGEKSQEDLEEHLSDLEDYELLDDLMESDAGSIIIQKSPSLNEEEIISEDGMTSLKKKLNQVDAALAKFNKSYSTFKSEYGVLKGRLDLFEEKRARHRREWIAKKYKLQAVSKEKKLSLDDLYAFLLVKIIRFCDEDFLLALVRIRACNRKLMALLSTEAVWTRIAREYFGRYFVAINKRNSEKFVTDLQKIKVNSVTPPIYWEYILKDFYQRTMIVGSAFRLLEKFQFPNKINTISFKHEINSSLGLIEELYHTLAYNIGRASFFVKRVKSVLMKHKGIYAIYKLVSGDDGVIAISATLVLNLLIASDTDYRAKLKDFLNLHTLQKQIMVDANYNTSLFAINASPKALKIIPSYFTYANHRRLIFVTKGCCAGYDYQSPFPIKSSLIMNKELEWEGAFLSTKGEVLELISTRLCLADAKEQYSGIIRQIGEQEVLENIEFTAKFDTGKMKCILDGIRKPLGTDRLNLGYMRLFKKNHPQFLIDEVQLHLEIAFEDDQIHICWHGLGIARIFVLHVMIGRVPTEDAI